MTSPALPPAHPLFLAVEELGGWEIAGLGLGLMVVVLGLSYGITILWQKLREPKRT